MNNEQGFNIWLPSNASMQVYPNNTPSHYRVDFNPPIDLPSTDWEVGLVEFSYVNAIRTLVNEQLIIKAKNVERKIKEKGEEYRLTMAFPVGQRVMLFSNTNEYFTIKPDYSKMRMTITLHRPKFRLTMRAQLAIDLGFQAPGTIEPFTIYTDMVDSVTYMGEYKPEYEFTPGAVQIGDDILGQDCIPSPQFHVTVCEIETKIEELVLNSWFIRPGNYLKIESILDEMNGYLSDTTQRLSLNLIIMKIYLVFNSLIQWLIILDLVLMLKLCTMKSY